MQSAIPSDKDLINRLNVVLESTFARAKNLSVHEGPVPVQVLRTAEFYQRVFGRRVVFFFDPDEKKTAGVNLDGEILYVNVSARINTLFALGHEFLHSLRVQDPGLYECLLNAFRQGLVDNDKQFAPYFQYLKEHYADWHKSDLALDKIREEFIADCVGRFLAEPQFLNLLGARLEPNLFRRLACRFMVFLDRVVEFVRRTPAPAAHDMPPLSSYVTDVERARELVLETLDVHARRMGPTHQPAGSRLSFLRTFHGSPHEVDKLSADKIGSGEGNQAFGYGLYFADSMAVAAHYRDLHIARAWRLGDKLVLSHDLPAQASEKYGVDANEFGVLANLLRSGYAFEDLERLAHSQSRKDALVVLRDCAEPVGRHRTDGVLCALSESSVRDDLTKQSTALATLELLFSDLRCESGALESDGIETVTGHVEREVTRLKESLLGMQPEAEDYEQRRYRINTEFDLENLHVCLRLLKDPGFVVLDTRHLRGHLYEVELDVDDNRMLDWDAAVDAQPAEVKLALSHLVEPVQNRLDALNVDLKVLIHEVTGQASSPTLEQKTVARGIQQSISETKSVLKSGKGLYRYLEDTLGGAKAASAALHAQGLDGIRYLDGNSRAGGEGTHNYVIFDAERASIQARLALADQLRPRTYIPSQESSLPQAGSGTHAVLSTLSL